MHGQGAGDGQALPLATAELVWIAIRMLHAHANQAEEIQHLTPFSRPAVGQMVHFQRPTQHLHDSFAWVQRTVGILKHQLDCLTHPE